MLEMLKRPFIRCRRLVSRVRKRIIINRILAYVTLRISIHRSIAVSVILFVKNKSSCAFSPGKITIPSLT